jgi:hypothetical protein
VGSNPIGSTNLLSSFQSDSKNFKGHQGALGHLRRQNEADDLTVRRALAFVHGLAVDVHRGTDIRVAHEFLLHFHRSPRFIRQGPESVAERVLTLRADGQA